MALICMPSVCTTRCVFGGLMSPRLEDQLEAALSSIKRLEALCTKEGARKREVAVLNNVLESCRRLQREEELRCLVERRTMQAEMMDDLLLRKAREVGISQRFFSNLHSIKITPQTSNAAAAQTIGNCYERAISSAEQHMINLNELRPLPAAYALADGSALATRSNAHILQIAQDKSCNSVNSALSEASFVKQQLDQLRSLDRRQKRKHNP